MEEKAKKTAEEHLKSEGWEEVFHKGKLLGWLEHGMEPMQLLKGAIILHSTSNAFEIQRKKEAPILWYNPRTMGGDKYP